MERRFKYSFDKRARRTTWAVCAAIALLFAAFYLYIGMGSVAAYFPAWVLSIVFMLLVIYLLSIPRFILVNNDVFEIHCAVELTKIYVEDIDEVRVMHRNEIRSSFPVLGSYAFGGYYGYYFNPADFSVFKMYASKWSDFVMIRDIYEDVYVVNCDEPEELVKLVSEARDRRREEIKSHIEG